MATRFDLHPHLRLGTRLTEARFEEGSGLCGIRTVCDGRTALLRARFFVCSTGPLSQPRWPDMPGLDDFAGLRLHSARWPDTQGLQALRVGLIGIGSTAAQLVPPLAARAAHLSVFQRTAHWVLPRLDRRYTPVDRALNALPGWQTAVRAFWYTVLEWGRRGFDVQHSLASLPVTGVQGRTLGRTSTLLYIEPGARWAVRAMQEVQRRGQRWLAVKADVQQRFNTTLQQRLQGAVWSHCRSGYRADSGRNIALWPGFTGDYRRAVQAQDFERDIDFG